MARLDVHRFPGLAAGGFVVDVQADLPAGLATRVVVPLLPESVVTAAARLNPVFEIEGEKVVLMVQSIATVPRRELRALVASLKGQRDIVRAAIDFLLTGF